ncbi:uncharacterized protein PG986_004980 [Apiospora aurea]|uniref:Uncharacterized protein n=1 Tax=Apiospora aurea TaxID=335848 RepID=A0ABR1QG95_9PEZI
MHRPVPYRSAQKTHGNAPPAAPLPPKLRSRCRSAAYCSPNANKPTGEPASTSAAPSAPPTPPGPRSLPTHGQQEPRLQAATPLASRTKEISSTGHFEPKLARLLEVPGGLRNRFLGKGLQVVRGNLLRGRPTFPDSSLRLRYVTEQHPPRGARERRDLDVRKVRAVCRLLDQRVMPLLASKVDTDRQSVLDALTEETVDEYM